MKKLKFSIWWLVKSPWAKKYGVGSVLKLWVKSIVSPPLPKSSKISICLCCYNRTDVLKNVFKPSLDKVISLDKFEVILTCSNSEKDEINSIVNGNKNIQVVGTDMDFSRSAYLNLALEHANYEAVLISDVDVMLPQNIRMLFYKNVNRDAAWFPICNMLDEQGQFSHTYPEGVGIVGFINKDRFVFDETIKSWGNEDWHFLYTLYNQGNFPLRTINDGFIHSYHPPVNKKNYKKAW